MIGSVCRIVCSQSDICYIGSTFKLLEQRMNGHRSQFKRWDEGKTNVAIAIYPYFQKYGPYEFKITLIKQYEVVDRSQLFAYEALWINKFMKTCANKGLSISPLKKQKQRETVKRFWEANKEALNGKCKQYNEIRKDRFVEKVTYECGGRYQYRGRTYHFKSKSTSIGLKLSMKLKLQFF
ncbi:hypothetical protein AM587_10004214 [Phytophthora nicotianae]|uniref:AP-4 complex subunit epsilon n=1 Tax=Phytophthora nicotianae TaxID=4792 RepID=A0A0W8D0N3_PHYNI|nr:AP-4 complex subunit epsilon [Phytophthora nicotianae]KUF89458.1 hypothetical protein AM587_10004214 [Phytophthora nicotianae]